MNGHFLSLLLSTRFARVNFLLILCESYSPSPDKPADSVKRIWTMEATKIIIILPPDTSPAI